MALVTPSSDAYGVYQRNNWPNITTRQVAT